MLGRSLFGACVLRSKGFLVPPSSLLPVHLLPARAASYVIRRHFASGLFQKPPQQPPKPNPPTNQQAPVNSTSSDTTVNNEGSSQDQPNPVTPLDAAYLSRTDEDAFFKYCVALLKTVVWVPVSMDGEGKVNYVTERMNAGLTREGEDKDLCTNVPVHILLETLDPEINGIVVNLGTEFCDHFDMEGLKVLKDIVTSTLTPTDPSTAERKTVKWVEDTDNSLEPFKVALAARLPMHEEVYKAYLEIVQEEGGQPYPLLLMTGKDKLLSESELDFITRDLGISMQGTLNEQFSMLEFDHYDPGQDEELEPFYVRKSKLVRVKPDNTDKNTATNQKDTENESGNNR